MSNKKELNRLKHLVRKKKVIEDGEVAGLIERIVAAKYGKSIGPRVESTEENYDSQGALKECALSDRNMRMVGANVSRMRSVVGIMEAISVETESVSYAPLLLPMGLLLRGFLDVGRTKNVLQLLLEDEAAMPSSRAGWNLLCQSLAVLGPVFCRKMFPQTFSVAMGAEGSGGSEWRSAVNWWLYMVLGALDGELATRVLLCYLAETGGGCKLLLRLGLALCAETAAAGRGKEFSEVAIVDTVKSLSARTPAASFIAARLFTTRRFSRSAIARAQKSLPRPLPEGRWLNPIPRLLPLAFDSVTDSNLSCIVSNADLVALLRQLPSSMTQTHKPVLVFRASEHGYSCSTLYSKAAEHRTTLMLVRTASATVLVAFTVEPWSLRGRPQQQQALRLFYGGGGTLVARIQQHSAPLNDVYRWCGDEHQAGCSHFQRASASSLEVCSAIRLVNDLRQVSSAESKTFNSPGLLPPHGEEDVTDVEILGFMEV